MCKRWTAILLTIMTCLPPVPALATENAFGRYIPGLFAGPASEIVPPEPGFYMQSGTLFYKGSADKSLQVPMGGTLRSNVKAEYFSTALAGVWVPEWSPAQGWNLALGLTLPLQTLYSRLDVADRGISDRCTSLGDIMLTAALGWHEGPHFAAVNLSIFAPTGQYNRNSLSNVGLNVWTFTPGIAYTYVNPERHLDFSMAAGIDINTWNNATHYRSGEMFHVDATLLGTYKGFGAGVFASVLYQISDDQGDLADRLNGFRGRSFSVGPMVKYSSGGERNFTVTVNWAPEFAVKNRTQGYTLFCNMSAHF